MDYNRLCGPKFAFIIEYKANIFNLENQYDQFLSIESF